MIYIKKNSVNTIVLTLEESSALIGTKYYIFSFLNEYDLTATPFTFYSPNLSSYTSRYDKFVITEEVGGSKTGGWNIPLELTTGQYTYTIYETNTMSLDILESTGIILEEGRMVVSGNDDRQVIGNDVVSVYT